MAYETTGNGYSVGAIPNYAAEDEQIQSGLSHRFDFATNPFLLAKNLQNTFLPYIEQQDKSSYQRASLNLDQQRQNLAQTAQNTLLPLQAQQLTAQTQGLVANAAMQSFQLGKAQDAYGQMPDYLAKLSQASQSGDASAAYQAGADNPAAFTANPNLSMDAVNRITQQQQGVTASIAGAAQSKGADYVSQNPNASPTDIESSFTPTTGISPAQQIQEKNAYIQGASHQHVQTAVAAAKGQITLAAAQIRQTGQIDAATQRALGPLISKGFFTPDALAAVGIDPDTSANLIAAVNSTPGANGSVVPDRIAVQNLKLAQTIINAKVPPSTTEKNWAYDVMNNGGKASFPIPIYPPAVQDKIDSLTTQISNLQNSLKDRRTWSITGQSPYDETSHQINALTDQLNDIKNNNAPQSSQTAPQNGGVGVPNAPRPTFGQNKFLPLNSDQSIIAPYNPQSTGDIEKQSSGMTGPTVVPGNPLTTNALDAGGGKGQIDVSPQAQPATAPVKNPVDAIPLTRQQIEVGIKWLQAHPDDAEVRAHLKANGVKGL